MDGDDMNMMDDGGMSNMDDMDDGHGHDMDMNDGSPMCVTPGMAMFMQGFSSLFRSKQNPCINVFFDEWVLDTEAKAAAAIIGVFCLALCYQYLQANILHIMKKFIDKSSHVRKFASASIYFSQLVMVYVFMLLVMTYAIEFFFAVIGGFICGYYMFVDLNDPHVICATSCHASRSTLTGNNIDKGGANISKQNNSTADNDKGTV